MEASLNTTVLLPEVLGGQDLTESQSKVKTDLPLYWEKDYVNQKMDLVERINHKVFFQTLWMSGIRTSEACDKTGFRKSDIDNINYTLKVRWLKNRKYNYRIIPLYPSLRDILQMYTAPMKVDDIVFPFTRQRAWQITKRHFGGHPHQFRHSFAVNYLRCGGKIEDLCSLLGHDDVRTTMLYRRLVPTDLGKELIKINFR
jgi:integrase